MSRMTTPIDDMIRRYAQSGTLRLHMPGHKVDTTGAGDAFNAGFLGAYLRDKPLGTCLKWGLASGSISVTRPGSAASCPTLEEVRALAGD